MSLRTAVLSRDEERCGVGSRGGSHGMVWLFQDTLLRHREEKDTRTVEAEKSKLGARPADHW